VLSFLFASYLLHEMSLFSWLTLPVTQFLHSITKAVTKC